MNFILFYFILLYFILLYFILGDRVWRQVYPGRPRGGVADVRLHHRLLLHRLPRRQSSGVHRTQEALRAQQPADGGGLA